MVPKESGFNQSETASSRFPGSPPMTRDGEVKQRQHFYHQVDTINPSKVRLCNNQTARNFDMLIQQ